MDKAQALWRVRSFTVSPTPGRRGSQVDIMDAGGGSLATCDADGAVRDPSGEVLLLAPLRQGRRDKPMQIGIDVSDAGGQPLGAARVVAYGLGPRAKKITLSILGPSGDEVARVEPSDKKGQRLSISVTGRDAGAIEVTEIKAGFMRKDRVYKADLVGNIPEQSLPLVFAGVVRHDALLNAVAAAANRD